MFYIFQQNLVTRKTCIVARYVCVFVAYESGVDSILIYSHDDKPIRIGRGSTLNWRRVSVAGRMRKMREIAVYYNRTKRTAPQSVEPHMLAVHSVSVRSFAAI